MRRDPDTRNLLLASNRESQNEELGSTNGLKLQRRAVVNMAARRTRRTNMPLLIPVLIGIPVVVGGSWVIYRIFV